MVVLLVVHLAGLVFARPEGVGAVVLASGAIYLVSEAGGPSTASVAIAAALLFLAAELAFWSFERRTPMPAERGVDVRRWLVIVAFFPCSMVLAMALMWIARSSTGQGTIIEILGVVAATGVLGVVALLTRRPRPVTPVDRPDATGR